ncbi:MAG: hypothetical protein FJ333_06220 [Sphingomonadales bacterium]|nr:hypothetical protein [Sphingomonadales bacterium]
MGEGALSWTLRYVSHRPLTIHFCIFQLNQQVTHVIFRDGSLANFKKAKRLGLPILSYLWVEACKEAGKLVPWDPYPSTSLER